MCLFVFVASDIPLPTESDEATSFLLFVQILYPQSEPVRRIFSKPYVYDLSSVGGCGCGFSFGTYELDSLSDAHISEEQKNNVRNGYEQSRQSVRLLRDLLVFAAGTGTVELYSCWENDEDAEPESRLDVTADHFSGDDLYLEEKQLLVVSR